MVGTEIPSKPYRILVVDDEALIRDLLCETLSDCGWTVDTAASADEAMALFESHAYDLVTLDCIMPDVSGVTLHKRLSKRFGHGHRTGVSQAPKLPPILFLSGCSGQHSVEEILFLESVAGVMQKPMDLDALTRVVRENLEARRVWQDMDGTYAEVDKVAAEAPTHET